MRGVAINVLRLNRETSLVEVKKAKINFTIEDGAEALTIRIGDEVIGFRFNEVQELIRQERMRNG